MRETHGVVQKPAASAANPATPGERLLWLCPIVGLLAGAVALWFFGLTLWTAIIVALLFGCPMVIAVALVIGRRGRVPGGEQS